MSGEEAGSVDGKAPTLRVDLPNVTLDDVGLRLLFLSPDCVKVLSKTGAILSINESGRALMEIDDLNSIEGTVWTAGWPDGARATVEKALASAIDGRVGRFTEFCPTAKGTPKWWDVVVSPVSRDGADVEAIIAVSRDVTQQKTIERQLARSQQQFHALADNMAQFAWMADPSGNIFWYNKRWFDYTGTTSEDMVGWGWQQVHHPDHAERVMKKIAEHFSSGEPWEDTFPLRARDGTYRWFLSRAMPSRDDAGNIVLWCGTNTDVTEQRDAADRLRQKAQLIAQSHEAIFVWDLERGIVSWNRGCEELYGYSASEVLGKRSHDLLRTRFSMSVEEFEERLRQDRSWAGEIEHCAKSGWPVWVDSRQELIDVGGRQLVLETNRDITEKRAAEDNRRLLLGELDHRVKNTLAIVQAIASQTARRTQSIESFTSSFGARLQALASAHNLLATTSWSGAWLHDIIASQLGETSAVAGQIRTAGPEAFLPQQVALQLSLIFHELGTNAVRFGALSRATGRIDVQWTVDQQQPHRLNLSWRESGGPPVERPRSRGFGTTLIERAGAQAQLTAELQFLRDGILCQVSADIGQQGGIPSPIFDPRARAWNSGGRRSAGMSRTPVRRVLVIEDEPLIALELEEILSSSGYESAGIAGSVSEALARIASSTPDLAILDGNLVGEKVDRVVADLELRAIPYVVVTGFTRESLPAAINPTLVPVLRKPVRAQELLSALQTLAGGGRRDV